MTSSSRLLFMKDGDYPMTETIPSVFICPTLVGRQPDLTALHMLIDRNGKGQGQTILICGEAGIGKSSLVAETKLYAAQRDYLLLEGRCFQTDNTFPYAPLLDLFRSFFTSCAPNSLAENDKAFVSMLSRLLPDLALLFPDLPTFASATFVEPEEEKRRLFAAMTYFMTDHARQHPVLLVVEDIHWCDDLSLDFLLHLARRCRNMPLILLFTYRSDEPHTELRQWLTQLDRERLTQEFPLARLSRSDVDAMVHAILPSRYSIDTDLLDTLYSLSEGNPFFVEELLKSLITTGELVSVDGTWKRTASQASIPRSIQDIVRQRTERLSMDAEQLLIFASVAGRRFNVVLLQHMLKCDEAHLLLLLKEVMAAQLVIEESADQFAFRHALSQQAIYGELLVRERQALHRTIAETLEQFSTSSDLRERYLGDLASHCYEAGMWEKAMLYSQQVGEQALTLYAQRAAIDHLTRAVDSAHHLSLTPSSQVYHARGQAYETLGDFNHARGDYERALDSARSVLDSNMEWQNMIALGFLWAGRDYEQAGFWFQQALELAEMLANPILRARSLNRLGNWLVNTGRTKEGLQTHQEALNIFETQQDTRGMAETLDLLGTAEGLYGDRVNSVYHLGIAIELFRTLADEQSLASSLAMRAIQSSSQTCETTFHALRTPDDCIQDAAESLRIARKTDSLSGQAFAECILSEVYSSFGEMGQAITYAQEAMRIAITIEHQQWIAATSYALGIAYLFVLQTALAKAVLETGVSVARSLGSEFFISSLTALQGLAFMMDHDWHQASLKLTTVIPDEQLPRTLAERQITRAWGELALAQGKPDTALQRAEHLLATVPGEQQSQPIPHLLKLKGEALMALSRFEEAARALEEAKRGAEMRHDRSILWQIHTSLGRVYHRLKSEQQAQSEYNAARQVIDTLAETIDETALREHFSQTAKSVIPQGKPFPQKSINSSVYGGLSTREREVAVLVAQGRTNREIATQLVVSERTAEAHVSNILGKLGFTTRAQIAAWAVEKGLSTSL
jgi:DNA-binding CsgD family transcriptional regulator/Flp pilus assembly protein TadD